ncbi:MAG: ABC transporter ATP-binding protein [Thermoleophilia bacterium]|nr:ABC transporter ATP-binding protein [Thermoleophilia bacterium]
MSKKAVIKLEKVSKDYRMGEVNVHALQKVDLEITAGEFVVLLGPSGCGKTTMLNLIGGLDKPTTGRIFVHGEEISALDEKALTLYRRRQVGFVFQFFNLIPTLSACENIELSLALVEGDGSLRARSAGLLSMVGLEDRCNHFPAQLSGGEQQRVAIARAFANQAGLLLCDEPTGNLDADTGQKVLGVVQRMNQEKNATVVLVTHNTAISAIANRVIHLRNGAIDLIEENDQPSDVSDLAW